MCRLVLAAVNVLARQGGHMNTCLLNNFGDCFPLLAAVNNRDPQAGTSKRPLH
jgi:hypothetical protein